MFVHLCDFSVLQEELMLSFAVNYTSIEDIISNSDINILKQQTHISWQISKHGFINS